MKSTDRILASRYARAYDALSQNAAQAVVAYETLQAASVALQQAQSYMQDPAVPTGEKQAFVQELFGAKNTVTHFLNTLLEAKRYYLLAACVEEVARLLDARQGIVRAQVETAFKLTQEQQSKVEETLSKFTGKTARAVFAVRPGLLGGLRARIEDQLIDGSLKGRFEKLQQQLTK